MGCLGIDIGGVIIQKEKHASDTSFFSDNFLNTPAVEIAFATIGQLCAQRYGQEIYLVSKCGPKIEAKTNQWLNHTGFYAATGVLPNNVHFCRERSDKAPICAALGVDCFIDDRTDVLRALDSVKTRLLFGAQHEASSPLKTVKDWHEVRDLLLPSA
ncbi:MAG: hypothetical protein V3V30_06230 [Parvularculaceae bacterium]